MKRRIVRLTILILLIGVVFVTFGQVAAKPEFPVFHSVETFCSAGVAERGWLAGNTHHGRNAIYTSIIESSNPDLAGSHLIHVNWNINLKTMKGVGWGTWESDGWRGTYNTAMHIAWPLVLMQPNGDPLWLNDGQVVGHGTGSNHGMLMRTEYYSYVTVFDDEPTGFPCVTGQTIDDKYFVLQSDHTGYLIGQ